MFTLKRFAIWMLLLVFLLPVLPGAALAGETPAQPVLGFRSLDILTQDDLEFKDLNKNGLLDEYEDWRKSPQQRAENLLSLMTAEEKAAQMIHLTMLTLKDSWFVEQGIGFGLTYNYFFESPQEAARKANQVQALCEQSRLGIPAVLSMDSVIGASWVHGATIIPDQIALAAAGDVDLVYELAQMQRQEMLAMGIRMSMSPVADLATDPRWGRVQECFGEDAELAGKMVAAAVSGLQNGSGITAETVIACVKHFPGSGPQTAGVDGTPLVFMDDSFQLHLGVFDKAIAAGAGAIMPYGYSEVPYLGGDAVENYAHESSTVMTELLRNKLGYQGLIQTDWGLSHVAAAKAGADVLGGAGPREIKRLAENLTTEELDAHVLKILTYKFQLAIFENPYVDEAQAAELVGGEANYRLSKQAAAKAMTLLKYEGMRPLAGQHLVLAGSLAENVPALSSGWKVDTAPGKDLVTALREKAGEDRFTYIGDDLAAIPAANDGNTVAVVVVGEASGTHEPSWGTKTLEFPEEQVQLVKGFQEKGIPVVAVVLMGRPYVMTPIVENSDAVMLAYRPGVTAGADAIAEALYGQHPITGRTPFQIPASMNQVLLQREDLPKDIPDPLFEYGSGLDVPVFGE